IVANKMDMPEAKDNLEEFKKKLATSYDEFDELPMIFPISSLAHQGLENLLEATAELLDKTPEFLLYDETEFQDDDEAYYGFQDDQA
ncbi:GTPase ObgE, partial [Streptococcus pyogenes]